MSDNTKKARELLAAELRRDGDTPYARDVMRERPEIWLVRTALRAVEAALSEPAAQQEPVAQTFQAGVSDWMSQCFVPSPYSNMTERGDRLLEEVLELLQAHGYDKTRVPTLVDYVFNRPVGEPAQEVGGVMVTLAGYCRAAGLDMHSAGDTELRRITQPEVMEKIRRKQEAKNALHFDSPLPGYTAPATGAVPGDVLRDAERWRLVAGNGGAGMRVVWWEPNGSEDEQIQFMGESFAGELADDAMLAAAKENN